MCKFIQLSTFCLCDEILRYIIFMKVHHTQACNGFFFRTIREHRVSSCNCTSWTVNDLTNYSWQETFYDMKNFIHALQDMYLYLSSFVVITIWKTYNKNVHLLNTMLHDKRWLYIFQLYGFVLYTVCLDTTQLIFSCWWFHYIDAYYVLTYHIQSMISSLGLVTSTVL